MQNWLRVDKVIAMKTVCSFFGPLGILTGRCCSAAVAVANTSAPQRRNAVYSWL